MNPTIRESLPDDLLPHELNLARIVPEALSLYAARYEMQRAAMSIKTERCGINDCLIEVAKKLFPGDWIQKKGLFLLCIGQYRIRLNKLSKKLRIAQNQTQLTLAFLAHKLGEMVTGDLFSPQITSLQLGYVPDNAALLNSASWIVRPDGQSVDWAYEMRMEYGQMPGPIPPATSPDDSPKPTVTPKRSDSSETGTSQGLK